MKLVLMRALIALLMQVLLWSCRGVQGFEVLLSLKRGVSNSFGEGLWQDTFLTVIAVWGPHFLALILVLIYSMHLRCLGCFSTAWKSLLYCSACSTQGRKCVGVWSNFRISCTLPTDLLGGYEATQGYSQIFLSADPQYCARRALCRYPVAWKSQCQPWGMLTFQPSFGKNQNNGNSDGKGDANRITAMVTSNPGKTPKLNLKVFPCFFSLFLRSVYLEAYPKSGSGTAAAWVAEPVLVLEIPASDTALGLLGLEFLLKD